MGTHFLIQNLTFSKRLAGIKDGLNTAFFSLSMTERSSEGSPLEDVFLIERTPPSGVNQTLNSTKPAKSSSDREGIFIKSEKSVPER